VDLDAGGELFQLGADGELEGRWGALPYEVLGDISLTGHFQAGLQLSCHQVGVELGAAVIAEGDAAIGAILRLDAAGQAAAAAGVSARAGFELDALDVMRAGAECGAWAYVSASGHLGVGVDVGHLVALVEAAAGGSDSLAGRLARIVLEEIELGLGVWGGVAAAAMAYGAATATLSLSDDGETDAGLTMQYEAALGAGAGGRVNVIVAGGFDDPRRMVGRLSRTSTRAFVGALREALPAPAEPALRLTELILPTAFAMSYELGQQTFLNTIGNADRRAQPMVLSITEQLQRFTLDGLLEVADRAAAQVIDRFRDAVESGNVDDATLELLRDAIPPVRELLERAQGTMSADITFFDLATVTTEPLVALIDLFNPLLDEQTLTEWGRPLAIVWSVAALLGALGPGAAPASAGATFLGFGPQMVGDRLGVQLPQPPQLVSTEIGELLGSSGISLTVADALGYLVAATPVDMLSVVPGLDAFLELCRDHLDIDTADLVPTLLVTGFTDGPGQAAYVAVQALIDAAITQYVAPMLEDARAEVGATSEAARWIDEVAEPAVVGVRDVVLTRVRAFVDGNVDAGSLQPLADAGGHLVYRLAVPAAFLVADQTLGLALEQISSGMRDLADRLRAGEGEEIVAVFEDTLRTLWLLPVFPSLPDATRDLAAELADITARAWGSQVITRERRDRLRHAFARAFANPVGMTLADAASWDAWLLDAANCEFVPAFAELTELGAAELDIIAAWFSATLVPTAEAIGRFMGRLAEAPKEWLEQQFGEKLRILGGLIAEAALAAADALATLTAAIEALQAALVDAADAAASVVEYIGSPVFAEEVLTRLDALVDDPADVGYQGLRAAIQAAWGILGDAADLAGDTIRGSADASAMVLQLAAAFTGMVAAGLQFVAGVTESDVDAAFAEAITVAGPPVIVQAVIMEAAKGEADTAKNTADEAEATAKQRDRDTRGLDRGIVAKLRILDPLPADRPEAVWYGATTPLHIEVDAAHPLWVSDSDPQIRLALNGEEFVVPPERWMDTGQGLTLTTELQTVSGGLRLGINTVELTVVTIREIKSLARAFLVDPASARGSDLKVDPRRSVLTTRGTDAQRAAEEVVVLAVGRNAIDFTGWGLCGRVGERLRLKESTVVGPNGHLYLHSGAPPVRRRSPDTPLETHRWWDRTAPVWSNRGDTVTVIDNKLTVRAVQRLSRVSWNLRWRSPA